MLRALIAIFVNIYMDGEKMFRGGGCVLYISLLAMASLFHWLDSTDILSNNIKLYIYVVLLILALTLLAWFTYYCIKHRNDDD